MIKKRNWIYIIVMPIIIVMIVEFIPTENLNILQRILVGGLIGFLVGTAIDFILKKVVIKKNERIF